jgi:hypothetical protein
MYMRWGLGTLATIICGAILAALVAINTGASVAGVQGVGGGANRYAPATGTAQPVAPLVERVKGWTAINTRVDRVAYKLVTWGEYLTGANQNLDEGADPNKLVWLVAVGGDVKPDTAMGRHFGWGVYAFDAVSGRTLSTNAGPEAWPTYFDNLVDRSH